MAARIPLPSLPRLLPLLLVLMSACSDGGGPAEPPAPAPSRIELNVVAAELELQDTLRLTATIRDADGAILQGITTAWSSDQPEVARVSPSGLVTGTGAGTATITVAAGSANASIEVTVLGWNIAEHAVVVDSTVLRLVSDSAERARGHYRFEVLGAAPEVEVGDVVVGAQGGGFLRKVGSVSATASEISLQTEAASLSEIIEEGGFQTVIDDLVFSPGGPPPVGPLRPGEVRWGAAEFRPALPGVALTPSGTISLSGLDVCKKLKELGGATCPSGISKLEIKTGVLDFGPQFSLDAGFSGLSLESFRGVAKGTVRTDFDVVLEAKTSSTIISPQIKIADITRPFYAQIGPVPVLGYVELALNGGLEAKATAKGSVEAGFQSSHSVEIGAEWSSAAGWNDIFDNQRSFDAREPSLADGTLSGQIDIENRLFLKPEIKVIFYGVVGPFLNVEPYGKFTMTFGTSACGMKSEAGINSEIGFTVPFLDPKVGNRSKKFAPWFSWPGRDWTCPLGTLDVSTVTNGQDPDPDGYTVVVDTLQKGSVASTGQTVIDFVEVGKRDVRLDGIASNCAVKGSNPVNVTVTTGLITPVTFEVECQAPGGDLVVEMTTTGTNLDPDGYRITVDRSQSRSVDTNGSVTFANVAQGDHEVAVDGIAANCLLLGSNPRTVTVSGGGPTQLDIEVDCTASQLVVVTSTQGPPASSDWSVILDGSESRAIGPNGQTTFDVAPGSHTVKLDDVAANCTIQGGATRSVDVTGTLVTETFDVTCVSGGLTVTATTTGDPGVTNFTAVVDGASKAVPVNGSVDFPNLPEGLISVRLDGVPTGCLIQDANPRQVEVPGATTFEVVCETPSACLTPPDSAYFDIVDAPYEQWDPSEPKPTMTWSIDQLDYGQIAVQTAMSGMTDNQSASIAVLVGWIDYWKFLPVDQTREGETVTVRVQVRSVLERQPDPDNYSRARSDGWGTAWEIEGDDTRTSLTVDEIVELGATLGDWLGATGYVRASTIIGPRNGGASASTRATQTLARILDVVDSSGISVPIVQICTASGTDYPR